MLHLVLPADSEYGSHSTVACAILEWAQKCSVSDADTLRRIGITHYSSITKPSWLGGDVKGGDIIAFSDEFPKEHIKVAAKSHPRVPIIVVTKHGYKVRGCSNVRSLSLSPSA